MNLKGQKVLVTGAGGFIGSHLVEALLEVDCWVRAFVHYNSASSWGWLDDFTPELLREIEVIAGDIRDPHGVESAVKDCKVIFHLAALIGIPYSYHSPDSYVDTNVKGALNILQSARKWNVEKTLITSTSEVYGTAVRVPIDEEHPFQAQSPYSATKIAADRLAESFYRSFELPVTIVRPFNTYGPRQSARAVIPTIITQLLSGSEKIHLGNLKATRDFNFVRDTVRGFLEIASSDKTVGQEINIASGVEISIGDLAHRLIAEINPKAQVVFEQERIRPEASEVERLLGCNRKIQALTGWKPEYDLVSGLRETIQWFREPDQLKNYKLGLYHV